MRKILLLVAVLTPAISACSRDADEARELAVLRARLDSLQLVVKKIEFDAKYADFFSKVDGIAYLTPGSSGYSLIQSDLGKLAVSLEDVRPYANGTRIVLSIGNLTSATINGAKASIEWGSVDSAGSPRNEAAKSRDATFAEHLPAGAWTQVPLVLDGVLPAEFGFVRIKDVTHTGIGLRKP